MVTEDRKWVRPLLLAGALAVSACSGGGERDDDRSPPDGERAPDRAAGPEGRSAGTGSDLGEVPPPPPVEALPETAGSGSLPGPLVASGEEPFWSADISDGFVVFRRGGLAEITGGIAATETTVDGDLLVDAAPLSVLLKEAACDLAGETYPYIVSLRYEEIDYAGCAFIYEGVRDEGLSTGGYDWSELVADNLTEIDICLDKVPEGSSVVAVYPRGEALTGVMLEDPDRRLYDCGVEAGTGAVAFLDPAEDAFLETLEMVPANFYRGTAEPGACAGQDGQPIKAGQETVGLFYTGGCGG